MRGILLALSEGMISQDIVTELGFSYQTVFWSDPVPNAEELPDICILDLSHWADVSNWMNTIHKTVYRLLLVSPEELNDLSPSIKSQTTDLLTLPLHYTELNIRLRNLFRMKDDTQQQRHIYEQLAITNHALESTSDVIVIADSTGVVIFVNQAFSKAFGYSVDELNVSGIPNILFQRPTIGEHVFSAVQSDGTWKGEVQLKTKRGEIIPFFLNVDRIHNDQDQPIGFISIGFNIRQQEQINAIQEEQRILVQAQLDTAKALTSTLDLTEVFERMLDNISKVVTNDAANIILIQDDKAQLVDRDDYSDKVQIDRLKSGEMSVDQYDDLRKILEIDNPLVISNTKRYLEENKDMQVRTPWLNSHIGIPIRLKEAIIGFINVDSIQPEIFTQEHAERLQLFAEQAAIAIQNARLYDRAQKLAAIEEGQRLARNLHDSVSQTLFSASIIAEALPELWQSEPDAVLPRLEQIRNLTRGAQAEMRTLLLELYPERLLETDISELINQLVEGVLGQTRINVTLDVKDDLVLRPEIHVAVYYITQETLNNVVKHAQATQITIRLIQQSQLTLTITDNGSGFDPEKVASTRLGLSNIQERARSTNAHLSIDSEIGKGTQVTVQWAN